MADAFDRHTVETKVMFFRVKACIPLVLVVAGLTLPRTARCQTAANDGVYQNEPPQAPGDNLPSEVLGADDLVALSVPYCTELSRTFRIGSDGMLTLPLLSRKLQAAGLKPDQLATAIQQELQREQVLNSATVNVSVQEYRSHPVSVVGAVVHPVTFQATGRITLLDALSRAGGISPHAGGTIILTEHAGSVGGTETVQKIPVADLLSGTDTKYNVVLHGGEEIRVPAASDIFVMGSVRHPGMYPMPADMDTTVMKAIALSEGLANYSAKTAFIYRRVPGNTTRLEIPVQLKSIMARKSTDVLLKPDDILYVPDAAGRRLTSEVLNQVVGFGSTAGSGLLIFH